MNLVVVEFGRKYRIAPRWSFNYLKDYKGLEFIEKYYEVEHTLPLADTISAMVKVCRRNGGTI